MLPPPADVFNPALLADRTALITGGSSGIGFEMARGLGAVGCRVVIAARTTERLEAAVAALRSEAVDASWKQLDVRDPEAVEQVVGAVAAETGGIDILINNAGGTFATKAEELSPNGWRAVVDLNLNGTFYCCSAVGRHMIERGRGGKILNITIGSADRSAGGIVHTGSSRAGVLHMTRTLAVEWAQFDIQVNAIGPQYLTPGAKEMYGQAVDDFITSSTPAHRWATGDELAAWAVVLTSPISAHFVDGLQTALGFGLRPGDSYVVHAPTFHGACWDHAKLFLLMDGFVVLLPRFEPQALMEAVSKYGISVLFGVPAVLRQVLSHSAFGAYDLSSIRMVLAGGALGASMVNREFEQALGRPVDFLQIYGLTEAGPFVTALPPELAHSKPQSIGRPLPGVELAIVDPETSVERAVGEIGEIAVRSSSIMLEYLHNPEATAAAIRDGWLHTGDLGRRDADGDHFIVDRLKDMIRSGGENVYAAEVERVLLEHPDILEAAVVGVPDERWDERVVAALLLRPGVTIDADEVRGFCRERLAAYKVPKQVVVFAELPKTGLGKIAKHELRAELAIQASS